MAGRKSDFTLPTLDDLFSTQEMRDDAKLAKIRDIPLELMLCKKYGVDTKNFAINRIPEEWKNKEPKEIRAELSKTRTAMNEIHSRVSEEMYRQKQERSKDRDSR